MITADAVRKKLNVAPPGMGIVATFACLCCHGTEFWDRPATNLGGLAGRVCSRCHPEPILRGSLPPAGRVMPVESHPSVDFGV